MPFTNTSFVRPQSDPFGPGNNQNSSFSKSGGEIRHMDQLPGMYMDRPPSFPTIPESPQTVSYYRDMMSNNGSNLPSSNNFFTTGVNNFNKKNNRQDSVLLSKLSSDQSSGIRPTF
jgi:hypothetical protein